MCCFCPTVRRPLSARCTCTQIALNLHRAPFPFLRSPRPMLFAASFAISNGFQTFIHVAHTHNKYTHTNTKAHLHSAKFVFVFASVLSLLLLLSHMIFIIFRHRKKEEAAELIYVSANKYLLSVDLHSKVDWRVQGTLAFNDKRSLGDWFFTTKN